MDILARLATGGGTPATPDDFERAADRIGCGIAEVRTIWQVEAGGAGLDGLGRPKILPEKHKVRLYIPRNLQDDAVRDGYAFWKWTRSRQYAGFGGGRSVSSLNARYDFLRRLEEWLQKRGMNAWWWPGLMGTSWGGPQIMGFNHKLAGFDTVEEMLEAIGFSEGGQLDALVSFLEAKRLFDDICEHDWQTVARLYNGAGQVATYSRLLANAFAKISRSGVSSGPSARRAAMVRMGSEGEVVEAVQRALIERGYHLGSGGPSNDGVDGDFGPLTRQVVMQAQREAGLDPVDGVVGKDTATWLFGCERARALGFDVD